MFPYETKGGEIVGKAKKKYCELRALKGKMRSEGQTTKTMADSLGIAMNTFNLKINGISEFTCSEIGEICKVLGIKPDNIVEFFFPSMFRGETKVS
jgi:DNA-binding Xre family transcriptional regulator